MPAAKRPDETVPESVPGSDQNVQEETVASELALDQFGEGEGEQAEGSAAEVVAPPSCPICHRLKAADEDENTTCWRCGYNPAAAHIHD
jgi:hypothetical protein